MAEFLGASVRRGVAGGHGGSRRWRRLRSGEEDRGGGEDEGEGEREGHGESRRGSRGVRGTLRCLQRRAGKQEVAGALGRAPRLASAYWQRRTTSGEVGGLGWSSWAAAGLPGKYSLSVLLFCFLFFFFLCFDLL